MHNKESGVKFLYGLLILILGSCSVSQEAVYNASWSSNDLVYQSRINGFEQEGEFSAGVMNFQTDGYGKVVDGEFTGSYKVARRGKDLHLLVQGYRDSTLVPTRRLVNYQFDFIITENLLTLVSGTRTINEFDTIDPKVYNVQVDEFKSGTFKKIGNTRQLLKETKWRSDDIVTFANNSNKTIFSNEEDAKGRIEVWFNRNQSTTILIYAESLNWKKRETYPNEVVENYALGEVCYRYNVSKTLGEAPYDTNTGSAEILVNTGEFFSGMLNSLTNPTEFTVSQGKTFKFANNVQSIALPKAVVFKRIQ